LRKAERGRSPNAGGRQTRAKNILGAALGVLGLDVERLIDSVDRCRDGVSVHGKAATRGRRAEDDGCIWRVVVGAHGADDSTPAAGHAV
jgi:hypothetical protein